MNLIQAVQSVFSKYATFTGRARRSEYWYFSLFNILCSLAVSIVFGFFDPDPVQPRNPADMQEVMDVMLTNANTPSTWASLLLGLVLLVPGLSVLTRRLHDTGRSGKHVVALYSMVVLMCVCIGIGMTSQALGLVGIGGLIGMAYLIYCIVLIVFLCQDSQIGDNQYGPNPKGESLDSSNY